MECLGNLFPGPFYWWHWSTFGLDLGFGVLYYWEAWSYFLVIQLVGVRAHQREWSGFEPAGPKLSIIWIWDQGVMYLLSCNFIVLSSLCNYIHIYVYIDIIILQFI